MLVDQTMCGVRTLSGKQPLIPGELAHYYFADSFSAQLQNALTFMIVLCRKLSLQIICILKTVVLKNFVLDDFILQVVSPEKIVPKFAQTCQAQLF